MRKEIFKMNHLQQHNEVQEWHKLLPYAHNPNAVLIIDMKLIPDNFNIKDFQEEWNRSGRLIYRQSEECSEPVYKIIGTQKQYNYDRLQIGEITMEEYLNLSNT